MAQPLPKNLSISPYAIGICPGQFGTIPVEGLCPNMPLKNDGIRILQNISKNSNICIKRQLIAYLIAFSSISILNNYSKHTYLPPTSDPIPKIDAPDAIAAPSPPDEPPTILPG